MLTVEEEEEERVKRSLRLGRAHGVAGHGGKRVKEQDAVRKKGRRKKRQNKQLMNRVCKNNKSVQSNHPK